MAAKSNGKANKGKVAGKPVSKDVAKPFTPKDDIKEVFRMWSCLPRTFLGKPKEIAELLGLAADEELVVKLMGLKTRTAFAEEYGVAKETLTRWGKEFEKDPRMLRFDRYITGLTNNVIGALYRQILTNPDAPMVKLWLQYVEGWREQFGVSHSGAIGGYELSDAERKELEKLMADNLQ